MVTEAATADIMRAIGALEGQQQQMNERMRDMQEQMNERMRDMQEQTNERMRDMRDMQEQTNERIGDINQRLDKMIFGMFGVGGAIVAAVIGLGVKLFLG